MDLFERALGGIEGGRVLDVATGLGGFVGFLAERLAGYTQIVGVDISARLMVDAVKDGKRENTDFIQMDAGVCGGALGLVGGGWGLVEW